MQILLGMTNIVKQEKMLKSWKYVAFFATIMGAVITPSTDPITQILMSMTIIILYLGGIFALNILKK